MYILVDTFDGPVVLDQKRSDGRHNGYRCEGLDTTQ
jgi:hypothetical protein